jgi:hypothetical protein
MRADLHLEWQRLTKHYRTLSDEELRELAAQISDLTETARQALQSEMKLRGIGGVEKEPWHSQRLVVAAAQDVVHDWDLNLYTTPPAVRADQDESDAPYVYTWKTQLCECETEEQVRQLTAALARAEIDNWAQYPDGTYPRILVAADQLDQARMVAAQPIPQDIVNESQTPLEVPEFKTPVCPKCGGSDPALLAVEPSNAWGCEACGQVWRELANSASDAVDSGQR